jgi:hypothetical protein
MAVQVIEKRKFVWKIKNFTKERYDSYENDEEVNSDSFEIFLGKNKTRW